jgi:hypothetical protein
MARDNNTNTVDDIQAVDIIIVAIVSNRNLCAFFFWTFVAVSDHDVRCDFLKKLSEELPTVSCCYIYIYISCEKMKAAKQILEF